MKCSLGGPSGAVGVQLPCLCANVGETKRGREGEIKLVY